jgi:predicted small integral membrane protein
MNKVWRGVSTVEIRNAYKIIIGKPKMKKPIWKFRFTCEDNIKMDLKEIGYKRLDWIKLAQGKNQWQALLNTVTYLRIP